MDYTILISEFDGLSPEQNNHRGFVSAEGLLSPAALLLPEAVERIAKKVLRGRDPASVTLLFLHIKAGVPLFQEEWYHGYQQVENSKRAPYQWHLINLARVDGHISLE
jgi:hypothetical protein